MFSKSASVKASPLGREPKHSIALLQELIVAQTSSFIEPTVREYKRAQAIPVLKTHPDTDANIRPMVWGCPKRAPTLSPSPTRTEMVLYLRLSKGVRFLVRFYDTDVLHTWLGWDLLTFNYSVQSFRSSSFATLVPFPCFLAASWLTAQLTAPSHSTQGQRHHNTALQSPHTRQTPSRWVKGFHCHQWPLDFIFWTVH